MKKTLLLCMSFGLTAATFAQTQPVVLPEFYSMKISPDGSVLVSEGFEGADIYNVKTGERTPLGEYRLGSGNCVSTDGSIIVATTEMDAPVIIKNGEEIDVTSITDLYVSSSFNAITGDGTRIVGWVSNPNMNEGDMYSEDGVTMYVPMYVELNQDGTLGEVKLLPYPEKDWLGKTPQYITASYISNDGKTILGQLVDNSGMCIYPVLFTEGNDGEWSYSLPTASLINPNELPLPEDPGEFTLWPPEEKDYMSEEAYAKYQEAYDAWVLSGYEEDLYHEIATYMTEAEIKAYNEAAEQYNAEAMAYQQKCEKYSEELNTIKEESVFFLQNGQAMDADAKTIAMAASKEVIVDPEAEWPEYETQYPTYILDVESGELKEVKSFDNGTYPIPGQVLPDGTVIASTPQPSPWAARQLPPQGYILLPESEEYVPVETKISEINAEAASWLNENYLKTIMVGYDWETDEYNFETLLMTGHICVSDDWSVVSGGVMSYLFNQEDEMPDGEEPNMLESYVICSSTGAVNGIESDVTVDHVKYYDMNGLEIKNPEKGIYVVRKVLTDGSIKTSKAVVK